MMNVRMRSWSLALVGGSVALAAACGAPPSATEGGDAAAGEAAATAALPACDPDNGGLTLPDGFCAMVVADDLGRARHLAVSASGDVYVRLREEGDSGGGVVALRDTTGDGRADEQTRFGDHYGTGIRFHGEHLYVSTDDTVMRYHLPAGQLTPDGEPETIVSDLVDERQHAAKSFVFDGRGGMLVNIGAPSNNCQTPDRQPGVAGDDPCTLLERAGGIWRFSEDETGQTQADGTRYATGLRNALALAWSAEADAAYTVSHGRDQLDVFWPDLFTAEQNAELPSEVFHRLEEGGDYGWPYCYHDPEQGRFVAAPEYGGDGTDQGDCGQYPDPLVAFPAHWGPNDLVFYTGDQYLDRYRGGAFVAFHGSWNRAPLPQQGYLVAFVPMATGEPAGEFEVFANGFTGKDELQSAGDAVHRPTGLAVGPDGSLYVADSVRGRIWRIVRQQATGNRQQG